MYTHAPVQEHWVHFSRTTGLVASNFLFSSAAADVPAGRCKGTRYIVRDNENLTKDTSRVEQGRQAAMNIGWSRAGYAFSCAWPDRPRLAARYPSISPENRARVSSKYNEWRNATFQRCPPFRFLFYCRNCGQNVPSTCYSRILSFVKILPNGECKNIFQYNLLLFLLIIVN